MNAIAIELERDTRTIASALRGVKPDGMKSGRSAWHLITVLKHVETGGLLDPVAAAAHEDRARLIRVRADIATMERDRLRRELVPVEAAAQVFGDLCTICKTKALAFPSRYALQLAAARTPQAVRAILDPAVDEWLNEMAGGGEAVVAEALRLSDDEEHPPGI